MKRRQFHSVDEGDYLNTEMSHVPLVNLIISRSFTT